MAVGRSGPFGGYDVRLWGNVLQGTGLCDRIMSVDNEGNLVLAAGCPDFIFQSELFAPLNPIKVRAC